MTESVLDRNRLDRNRVDRIRSWQKQSWQKKYLTEFLLDRIFFNFMKFYKILWSFIKDHWNGQCPKWFLSHLGSLQGRNIKSFQIKSSKIIKLIGVQAMILMMLLQNLLLGAIQTLRHLVIQLLQHLCLVHSSGFSHNFSPPRLLPYWHKISTSIYHCICAESKPNFFKYWRGVVLNQNQIFLNTDAKFLLYWNLWNNCCIFYFDFIFLKRIWKTLY